MRRPACHRDQGRTTPRLSDDRRGESISDHRYSGEWQILPKFKSLPDIWATTWSYNGQIPGPMIRVTQGDRIRVILKNELPDSTSIHWHGLRVPHNMDGVAEPAISQQPVKPGETFTDPHNIRGLSLAGRVNVVTDPSEFD